MDSGIKQQIMAENKPAHFEEYFAQFPKEVREILQKIRETIQAEAPDAHETISYGMPTFKMKKNLLHFAAYKNHIGFYPTPSGVKAYEDELVGYEYAKGSIKFPLTEPIPFDLIAKITRFRVKESLEKK